MTARRNIMRKFRIGEISGVDHPCQALARAVIFKRSPPASELALKATLAPDGADWSKRQATALQTLQKLAEERAVAKGETVPPAYAAVMATPEGMELYQRAS